MDINNVRILLDKYFEGNTSIGEENLLRDYFLHQTEIPEDLYYAREHFVFLNRQSDQGLPEGLMDKIEKLIDSQEEKKIVYPGRKNLIRVLSIAASLLIIVGLYFTVRNIIPGKQQTKIEDTFKENPELAYLETQKVLYYVSQKLNKGTQPLSNISKLNVAAEQLQYMEKIDEGLDMLEKLQLINKTENTEIK
ncbi:MAG: hypothetical protein JXJ22_00530 [Bacteroidales bacterium]|nr:hypothetical protein [Bacteroidales bacterium]